MAEGGEGVFNFDNWCRENNIKEDTKKKLQEQDIEAKEDLIGLSDSDIVELNLTLGQRNALKLAVKRLHPPTPSNNLPYLSIGAPANPLTTGIYFISYIIYSCFPLIVNFYWTLCLIYIFVHWMNIHGGIIVGHFV